MVRCCQSRLIKYRIELRMRNLFPIESNRSTFILYINPCVFRPLSITFIQEDSVMAQVVDCRFAGESRPNESPKVHTSGVFYHAQTTECVDWTTAAVHKKSRLTFRIIGRATAMSDGYILPGHGQGRWFMVIEHVHPSIYTILSLPSINLLHIMLSC
jgi:hypothetical protein